MWANASPWRLLSSRRARRSMGNLFPGLWCTAGFFPNGLLRVREFAVTFYNRFGRLQGFICTTRLTLNCTWLSLVPHNPQLWSATRKGPREILAYSTICWIAKALLLGVKLPIRHYAVPRENKNHKMQKCPVPSPDKYNPQTHEHANLLALSLNHVLCLSCLDKSTANNKLSTWSHTLYCPKPIDSLSPLQVDSRCSPTLAITTVHP